MRERHSHPAADAIVARLATVGTMKRLLMLIVLGVLVTVLARKVAKV